MKNSHNDSNKKLIQGRASGYQMSYNLLQNAEYLSETLPYAAGSLVSNVGDLLKWNNAILENSLISEESREKAWTAYTLKDGSSTNYGYGWSVGQLQEKRMISHSGGIFGFLSMGILLPDEEIFVAVLSNCNCQDPGTAAFRMAAQALGYDLDWKPIEVAEADLKKFEGNYPINDEESRVLEVKNGKLYSQRGESSSFALT